MDRRDEPALLNDKQSANGHSVLNRDEERVERHAIPLKCSLEAMTEVLPLLEGVTLESCAPFDVISARTANTNYHFLVLDPNSGRVLLDGGKRFPEPIEATILGSSFGGSMIRMGWVGVGLRIELCANDKYIITSPVQQLAIERTLTTPELTSDLSH
jgi:hypothetical protein